MDWGGGASEDQGDVIVKKEYYESSVTVTKNVEDLKKKMVSISQWSISFLVVLALISYISFLDSIFI